MNPLWPRPFANPSVYPAALLQQWNTDLANALDAVNGGTYALNSGAPLWWPAGGGNFDFEAPVTLSALTQLQMSGTATPTFNSRTVARVMSSPWIFPNAGLYLPVANTGGQVIQLDDPIAATPLQVTCAIHVPHGATITKIEVAVQPVNGAIQFPPTQYPRIDLRVVNNDGTQSLKATTVDSQANTGAYQAWHLMTLPGLNIVVDRTSQRYVVLGQADMSTTDLGFCFGPVRVTYTTAQYDED